MMTNAVVDAGDDLPLTIPALLRERAARRGDHPLLICDDDVVSYDDAKSRSGALAKGLLALGAAGVIGVIGNWIAARIRLDAGRRLDSPALIADGQHARSDAIVSAGVVLTAGVVAVGLPIADPIMGLVITGLILQITWQSWKTVRGGGQH